MELDLAKLLDPADPTAWLYSALLRQQDNHVNSAVHDLEQSKALNQNRRVYRSQLLLDQDLAVRGANLAAIYRDAGLRDLSVREAVRAVQADYGNFSAHLFLANSYGELRDPSQVNLRYETAVVQRILLANLLAPVGAGILSPTVFAAGILPLVRARPDRAVLRDGISEQRRLAPSGRAARALPEHQLRRRSLLQLPRMATGPTTTSSNWR